MFFLWCKCVYFISPFITGAEGKRSVRVPREEIGMHFSITGRIVYRQTMGVGHMARMEQGQLQAVPKRAEAMKQPGRRKRVRPQLRWEDYVKTLKRDVTRQRRLTSGGRRVLIGRSRKG